MSSIGGTVSQQGLIALSGIKPYDLLFSAPPSSPNPALAKDFGVTNQPDRLLRPLVDVTDGSVATFNGSLAAVTGQPVPVQMSDYAIVRLYGSVTAGNLIGANEQSDPGSVVKIDPASFFFPIALFVALESGQSGDLIWAYRVEGFFVEQNS